MSFSNNASHTSTPSHSGHQQQSSSGGISTPTPSTTSRFLAEEKKRRTSLQVLLPKLPSSDSLSQLNNTPSSPGLSGWNDGSPKDYNSSEKIAEAAKLNRKESYKAQRKNYRKEKKRVASELLNSLQDPGVIVLADWLKVRGTLKSWTKLWCCLKPGLMLIYKSPKLKSSHWVGTVLLTSCQVIERPSKKDGFCFKLFHTLDQTIWAPRGPDKETLGAITTPLPTSYLIFRAPSQAAGKCWMDALELSLRCSALLVRSVSTNQNPDGPTQPSASHETQWSEADYEKHFDEHGPKTELPQVLLQYFPPTQTPSPINQNSSLNLLTPCPSPSPMFQHLCYVVTKLEEIFNEGTSCPTTPNPNMEDRVFVKRRQSVDMVEKKFEKRLADFRMRRCSMSVANLNVAEVADRRRSSPGQLTTTEEDGRQSRCDIRRGEENLDVDSQVDGGIAIMSCAESESDSDVADVVDSEEECLETPYVLDTCEAEFGAAGEQVEELAEEHKSLIWFLVKQVRPGMDLSKVVLPTFILEPRSFLDKLSDSYYHADLLSRAVLEEDPFNRMKTVVQWYLSGFYKKPKGLKKPYNPILGETFRCYWEHENGSRTFYIAEQVSHHPPISAFYVTNRQEGFSISCSILAKSKFYGNSTSAILDGVATLTLLPRMESYTLAVPYAHCKGILMGTLSMELGGKICIECENTGYKADLEFKLKPIFGGGEQTNVVTGRLKLGKETLATINGHWDGKIMIKDSRSNEETVLFNPTPEMRAKRLKRFTVPMEHQANNESEKLWQHVSAAIYRDDQVGATEEKTVLEEIQRNAAKELKAKCADWIPLYFQQDFVSGQYHYKFADLRPWDLRNDLRQYESNYRIQTKTKHQAPIVRTASLVSSEPLSILHGESNKSLIALKKSRRVFDKSIRKLSPNSTPEHVDNNSDSSQCEFDSNLSNTKLMETLENMNKRLNENTMCLSKIQLNIEKMAWSPPHQKPYGITAKRNFQSIAFLAIALLINVLLTCWLSRK